LICSIQFIRRTLRDRRARRIGEIAHLTRTSADAEAANGGSKRQSGGRGLAQRSASIGRTSTKHGRFDRFDGSYEIGTEGPTIDLTVDADSLDTGNTTRDKHLRSPNFFHTAEHPQIRFTSTRVDDLDDGTLRVEGTLEAAGKVVPLEFAASMERIGDALEIEATTTVDQRQLGMSSGKLGMIRPPVTLHVRPRLSETAAAERRRGAPPFPASCNAASRHGCHAGLVWHCAA